MGEQRTLKLTSLFFFMLSMMMSIIVGMPVDNLPHLLSFGQQILGHYRAEPDSSSKTSSVECKANDRFHLHKTYPMKYHVCVKAGGKWTIITLTCPLGANFNNKIKKCMLEQPETTQPPDSTSTQRPGSNSTDSQCFNSRSGKLVGKKGYFGNLKSKDEKMLDDYDDEPTPPGEIVCP